MEMKEIRQYPQIGGNPSTSGVPQLLFVSAAVLHYQGPGQEEIGLVTSAVHKDSEATRYCPKFYPEKTVKK